MLYNLFVFFLSLQFTPHNYIIFFFDELQPAYCTYAYDMNHSLTAVRCITLFLNNSPFHIVNYKKTKKLKKSKEIDNIRLTLIII